MDPSRKFLFGSFVAGADARAALLPVTGRSYDAVMSQKGESVPAVLGESSGRGHWWLLGAILMGACVAMRVPGLMALPIFGDEAIYLRWAQLVRGEGVGLPHPWVSLADPKPPLHFWLMAAVFHWTSDPLHSARLISVLAGALSVGLMLAVGSELGSFIALRENEGQSAVSGRVLGVVAAVLAIFCPFLAFYQRLATADAFFVCESLAIVWLSLLWGRLTVQKSPKGRAWIAAVGLGVAIGAGLMTRQGISYTICATPVAGWLGHAWMARSFRWLSLLQLVLVAVIAGAIWTPYLTAELHERALAVKHEMKDNPDAKVTNAELWQEMKRRILYQESITGGRGEVAARNAMLTFVPRWTSAGEPVSGWFFFYLTPAVYGACLVGLIYTAVRQWRMFVMLMFWLVLMLGPVVFLASSIFSRYVLAAAPPLLLAGGYWLAAVSAFLLRRAQTRPVIAWGGVMAIWALVILGPLMEMGTQATRWWKQTLTVNAPGARGDRYQYVTGWTAGYATDKAIREIWNLAKVGPLVVITDNAWGTPADALWTYLSPLPNVRMYYTDDAKILIPGAENGTYQLKDDKWLFPKLRPVRLPEKGDAPIIFVTGAVVHSSGPDEPAEKVLQKANPNLQLFETFNGVVIEGQPEGEGVAIFKVSPSPPSRPARKR